MIADHQVRHLQHLYPFRKTVEFERELDWLLARFQAVDLQQLVAAKTQGTKLPRKSFFLSFDDGFREMAEVVAPICKRKGVPVTFFLTTDFLDNRKLGYRHKASVLLDVFSKLPPEKATACVQKAAQIHHLTCGENYREFVLELRHAQTPVLDDAYELAGLDFGNYLRTERPYLDSEQVQGLLKDGFSIGAHSLDHPRYSEIPLDEQISQTRDSVQFLEKKFDLKPRSFAFPFVSDDVGFEFYERVFADRICDIVFCIGAAPDIRNWPLVERFGVERPSSEPISQILRDMKRRNLRARVSRLISPLRKLMK